MTTNENMSLYVFSVVLRSNVQRTTIELQEAIDHLVNIKYLG